MAVQREGLRVRKLADESRQFVGTALLDLNFNRTDVAPAQIRVPTDYAQREPWVELVNPTPVLREGGPASNPTAVLHTFVHVDALILHTVTGDYRYKVVHQPDKYYADGVTPGAPAGDPTAVVDWYYDADLES